jgi:AMMECR1 domain-containing protein
MDEAYWPAWDEARLVKFVARVVESEVLALAESELYHPSREFPAPGAAQPPADRVNVTLRCDGRVRGSMSAPGNTLAEQITNALQRATTDQRFRCPVTREEMPRVSIEVWIQLSSTDLGVQERLDPASFVLGADGLEVSREDRAAYYKPSVAITSGMQTLRRMLRALCRKAGLSENSWEEAGTTVKKSRWLCISVSPDSAPVTLTYLRKPPDPAPTRETIAEWIAESCEYFARQQSCTGAISYIYEPLRDEIRPDSLSLLRACGCLYSLARALDTSAIKPGPKVLGTAERLGKYLVGHSRPWQAGCRIVDDADPDSGQLPKVGTTALLLLALSNPTLRAPFRDLEPEFRASIHRCQKENGRFVTHFGSAEEMPRSVEFYPGQVLLNLALEVEAGSTSAANMCSAAFEPYRRHFSAAPTTAFVGWQVDVWSRLAKALQNEDYASFAFQQVDWLLAQQLTDNSTPANQGGFARDARDPAFSSIVFVEAVIRALELAAATNDSDRVRRYSAAARLGLSFCQRLQLKNVPAALFVRPGKCVGGIAMAHDNLDVRCDVVQHFLTLSLAAHQCYGLIYP